MTKRDGKPFLRWATIGMLQLAVVRKKRMLVLQVTPLLEGQWLVGAVETANGAETLDQVFEDHGHRTIGTCESVTQAIALAEAAAADWHAGKGLAGCACQEIE